MESHLNRLRQSWWVKEPESTVEENQVGQFFTFKHNADYASPISLGSGLPTNLEM